MDQHNQVPKPVPNYDNIPYSNQPPIPTYNYNNPWNPQHIGNNNQPYWPFAFGHAPPPNIPSNSPFAHNPVNPPPYAVPQHDDREFQRVAIENYIVSLLGQSKHPEPTYSQPIPIHQEKNDDFHHHTSTSLEEEQRIMDSISSNMESLLSDEINISSLALSSSPLPEQLAQPKKFVKNKAKRKLLYLPLPSNYDALNKDILEVHASLKPTLQDVVKRQKLLSSLQAIVTEIWPDASPVLHLFGSSANDFGLADCDLCLSIDESVAGIDKRIVQKLGETLRKKEMRNVKTLPKARVPIVKFTDTATNISCDICFNNRLALQNTRLLADYSKIDERTQQLGFLIKYWAKRRMINEPYSGTLSSYAYILMVIHFLQTRSPPILPCLQQLAFNEEKILVIDGFNCYYYDKIDALAGFGKANKQSIGELLTAFFRFYACEFDYEGFVLSVRTGRYLTKSEKQWDKKSEDPRENFHLTIEDPFEITHNLGRVVDTAGLKIIQEEFERAFKMICNNDPLASICKKYKEEK